MFARGFLVGVRRKALRRRVWWRALDGVERAIVDLTIRVVDRVQSVELGIEIVKVLKKLKDAMKTPFVRLMETHGLEWAKRLSDQASSWGYRSAKDWSYDFAFIKYLTVLEMNNPAGFRHE